MRMIDADFAKERIKKSDLTNREKIALLLMLEEVPTLAPPPNDPLTLEELREMGGQAVWISPIKENGEVSAQWMLVSGYTRKEIYLFASSCHIMQGYDRKAYGKTWLAYRRKPEEGET